MIMTKRSVAEDLIQPVRLSFSDEIRKLYIGRLPKGTTEDLIEKLLKCCGDLKGWKRSKDASGEPKAFGFAEFDNLEAVFAALKLLNNAALTVDGITSRLLVKADEKTT
jgi:RNA-binding protein 25